MSVLERPARRRSASTVRLLRDHQSRRSYIRSAELWEAPSTVLARKSMRDDCADALHPRADETEMATGWAIRHGLADVHKIYQVMKNDTMILRFAVPNGREGLRQFVNSILFHLDPPEEVS